MITEKLKLNKAVLMELSEDKLTSLEKRQLKGVDGLTPPSFGCPPPPAPPPPKSR